MGKREILFIIILALVFFVVNNSLAQSASATQRIVLHLYSTIEISALNTSQINFPLQNSGKQPSKARQEVKVHSNNNFIINITADSSHFSYNGPDTWPKSVPSSRDLLLAVSGKNDQQNGHYAPLEKDRSYFINGNRGSDQLFAVDYKVNRRSNYQAGNYTVGVIYTATEP